ncbi:MAG TPA: Azurin [Opitutae bacterium]|nr:Azurin [Opitutae bacterium]
MKAAHYLPLFTVFLVTACGPQPSEGTGSSAESVQATAEKPTVETVEGVTTVRIDGNDRMQFTLTEFTVKAGDTVRIIFENKGRMPKTAMGHNVVVLKKGVDANAYAGKAALARDTDFIPASEADSVIAHTKLLGPEESDTIEFTAPEPGDYVYLCSFPAHCFAGMRGIMTVKE